MRKSFKLNKLQHNLVNYNIENYAHEVITDIQYSVTVLAKYEYLMIAD
jgi:hypothetical protein